MFKVTDAALALVAEDTLVPVISAQNLKNARLRSELRPHFTGGD